MGLFVGIGNYIGNRRIIGKKDPQNLLYNLITEQGTSILTEYGDLILREIEYNIVSEDNEYLVTELGQFIIKENDLIYPEGLIARYACYDKTNEDEDRDVLKDLSGNGHDIQLYNFTFSDSSGYGIFGIDFNKASSGDNSKYVIIDNKSKTSITFHINQSTSLNRINIPIYQDNIIIKVSGLNGDNKISFAYYTGEVINYIDTNIRNGIKKINIPSKGSVHYFYSSQISDPVTIDILPEYKGALVSDGVDDYGLCENFPILDRDRGYTIISIRKWINIGNKQGIFLSNALNWGNTKNLGAFVFERFNTSTKYFINCGLNNSVPFDEKIIVHSTSINYNSSNPLKKGDNLSQNNLYILGDKGINQYANIALYALEIYDRDLTDEEIAKVRERMIAEYEAKTGEKYVEYLKLDQGKLDINKLK